MLHKRITALALASSVFASACMACCGTYYEDVAFEYQRQSIDESPSEAEDRIRRQRRRDAEFAQMLAQQELDIQRQKIEADQRRKIAAEQQYLLEIAAKQRQERRDAELAQRIAQQELETERRRLDGEKRRLAAAEQQRLLDEAKRQQQIATDAALAQRIAQQEAADRQRHATAAEQQRLLSEAKKQQQIETDAALAQRLAQDEAAANQRRIAAEQKRQRDADKQRQIAADEALAQQLYAEELQNFQQAQTTVQAPRATQTPAAPVVPAVATASTQAARAVMTTALPMPIDNNSLKNWLLTNNVMPNSTTVDNELCVVCISTPVELEGSRLVKLPCKHIFCGQCTMGMVANKPEPMICPTCRDESSIAAVQSLIG